MNNNDISFAENFQRYFSVRLAVSPEDIARAYRLRYRVYCEELGYESAERFADGEEFDDYDAESLHIIIVHRRSNKTAGCVRLVKPMRAKSAKLPFEKKFPESLDPEFFSRMDLGSETVCEISRLAVDSRFRRRYGESFSRLGDIHAMDISYQEQRSFSLIAEAAFLAAAVLTSLTGRTNAFALMEPYLCRLLNRSGIHFMRVGKDVEHHGSRAAYFLSTESLLNGMRPDLQELYEWVKTELERAYKVIDVAA